MIDTLRADALGAYGNDRVSSPNLDAIASEGVVFERAISASPWTQPSMASLFGGIYPGVHHVLSYRQAFHGVYEGGERVAVFGEQFETLAESLHEHGYQTAAFVANPFLAGEFGFAQGFEHYDASFARNTTPGDVVNTAALKWLRGRDPSRPFLLYLHYMDVHGPYNAGPDYLDELLDEVERRSDLQRLTTEELSRLDYLDRLPVVHSDAERHARLRPFREYWVARYEAGVREADHHVGALREGLSELGLWDDAFVVLVSDHGESLCEHGIWDHGSSAYDVELHVPLVLRWPGRLPAGSRYRHRVRLIDLYPTVLDRLELPVPDGLQGRALESAADEGPGTRDRSAMAEGLSIGPDQKAIYEENWKLVLNLVDGAVMLFDLATDPAEQRNLAAQQPERARRLRERLLRQDAINRELGAGFGVQHEELSSEEVERLRSLGYLN